MRPNAILLSALIPYMENVINIFSTKTNITFAEAKSRLIGLPSSQKAKTQDAALVVTPRHNSSGSVRAANTIQYNTILVVTTKGRKFWKKRYNNNSSSSNNSSSNNNSNDNSNGKPWCTNCKKHNYTPHCHGC